MVLLPPIHGILTPYPWYIDPLPMVFYALSMVYQPSYLWYIDPLPMVYRPPYPWYIDPLPMVL